MPTTLAGIDDRKLEIKIVVGPSFDAGLQASIERATTGMSHETELVRAPRNLVEQIAWCDLGLGATGLTKYEIAFMGKPSMQLAMDPLHGRLNQAFAGLGATHYLGVVGVVPCQTLALEIAGLLDDAPRREAMAERAGTLVDGRGADRILDLIEGRAAHG